MRRWPQVRAGLVTLAIAVGLADGCPLPTTGQVAAPLRAPVRAAKKVRHLAMTPFRPLGELLRLRQRWKLFPTARRDQVRMWIEARDAETKQWSLLYRAQDDEHDWMADRLGHRRLRGAWNPGSRNSRGGYAPLVDWIAREVFAEDAGIDQVRVRMETITLEPEEGRFVGSGRFIHGKLEHRR